MLQQKIYNSLGFSCDKSILRTILPSPAGQQVEESNSWLCQTFSASIINSEEMDSGGQVLDTA